MIVNADEEGWDYRLINLNTKKEIEFVIWANDETGEYDAMQRDENGIICDENGEPKIFHKKGNIRLEKID